MASLHNANVDKDTLGDWFQACRVEAQERLRDQTYRVQTKLGALLAKHQEKVSNRDFPVVLLNERGEAEILRDKGESRWPRLSDIVEKGFSLRYRTLVLPTEAGGLNADGMLDASALDPAHDVAEERSGADEERRERWLLIQDADGKRYDQLMDGESAESLPPDLKERERVTLGAWVTSLFQQSAGMGIDNLNTAVEESVLLPLGQSSQERVAFLAFSNP